MKLEVRTREGLDAITSDHWHVIRSRLLHPGTDRPYERTVESEHGDRASCVLSALTLRRRVAADSIGVPEAERDEVIVCRPNFKSLKAARSPRHPRMARKRDAGPGDTAPTAD